MPCITVTNGRTTRFSVTTSLFIHQRIVVAFAQRVSVTHVSLMAQLCQLIQINKRDKGITMQPERNIPIARTRAPGLLVLVVVMTWASTAEARLFWQTYGSIVPSADGCGCNWNVNQDYFVPRHPTSSRYGLWSPCKTSCTTSPACKWCHPLYPGYCGIYGPCHYCWRDHVYGFRCGCTLLRIGHSMWRCGHGHLGHRGRSGCCCGNGQASCCAPMHGIERYVEILPPPNVEVHELAILGSIPVEGNELFEPGELPTLDGNLPGD